MNLIIKSRRTKEIFSFWMDDKGGYIHLESDNRKGFTGRQICRGGWFLGSTIIATPNSFEKTCRNWYRTHMRNEINL